MGTPITHHSSPITGFYTLFYKEWLRFWKVSVQTILAPVLTALLFLVVFAYSLRGRIEVFPGVEYGAFLVPGLAMMSVLQNAFANSSSSLMQSKMTGNIVFVLLPPFSHREFFAAYLLAAVARGLVVGAGVFVATVWFVDLRLEHPLWVIGFAVLGSGVMGVLGIIAGIHSDKVDELEGVYREIAAELKSQYYISYEPSATDWDGRWRKIEVRVKGRDELIARTRTGYYAFPPASETQQR